MALSVTSLTLVADHTIPMTEVWVHPDMVAQFRAAFLEADLLRSLDPTTRVCAVVVHPFTSMGDEEEFRPLHPSCRTPRFCVSKGRCMQDPTCTQIEEKAALPPPYPFCRRPKQCAGKGYCRNDPACNN
jgi:hypothetical protein